MLSPPERKVLVLSSILLLPALLAWSVALSLARSEEAEFTAGVGTSGVVVEVLEDKARFNGRTSEEITEVHVRYTPQDADAPVVASVAVWSADGLSPGTPIQLRYLPSDPQRMTLVASFWHRSSAVVSLTLFGGMWLLLDGALAAILLGLTRRRSDEAAAR
jgi:hypothetical protein